MMKATFLAVVLFFFAGGSPVQADDDGWIDLNAPSPAEVDKLIIQDNRPSVHDSDDTPPPPPKTRPKPKPPAPPAQPKPKPQSSGACTSTAISITPQGSSNRLDRLYVSGTSTVTWTASVAGTSDSSVSARIVPGRDYASRRLGTIKVNGNRITYTTPSPEDSFEGVVEIRSAEDSSLCRSIPISVDFGGCVQAGTRVSMADGSRRAIESLTVGEQIVAYDTNRQTLSQAVIEKVLVHDDITYILHELVPNSGEPLLVTGNHPILVKDRGWQQVDAIRPGDVIFYLDRTSGALAETTVAAIIRDKSHQGTVYNLKTNRGTYLANDLLIHNKCLAKGTMVDTPYGSRAIETLQPGDLVMGDVNGMVAPVRVTNVYAKDTVLPHLPGKELGNGVLATANHLLLIQGNAVKAGDTSNPDVKINGTVYDIRTESGTYRVGGMSMLSGD